MVLLSRQTEQRDVLDVLAASRREVRFNLSSSPLLRASTRRTQRNRLRPVRQRLAEVIEATMDAEARGAFRGRAAVEMRLALPAGRDEAELAHVVKGHLDLLTGTIVPDDKVVDHLIVLRELSPDTSAHARLTCLPSALLVADYDRAFRVLSSGSIGALVQPPKPAGNEQGPAVDLWGLRSFDQTSQDVMSYDLGVLAIIDELDDQEDEQLDEDPNAYVELDVPPGYEEFEDSRVRDDVRRHFEGTTARARGDRLTDQGFDVRDRPGRGPAWVAETVELDAADVVLLADQSPGTVLLPAPPTESTPPGGTPWRYEIERLLREKRRRAGGPIEFGGPLALDIALRGRAGGHMDVDNAARGVLQAFKAAFADAQPQIGGFRVYRQPSEMDDVRVRVMPAVRLHALSLAMAQARAVLSSERSERLRG